MENKMMFTFPLLVREDYYSIICNEVYGRQQSIIMTGITEDEEAALDSNIPITIERGNLKFHITAADIQAYGEIDFTDNGDDLDYFVNMNWFKQVVWAGFSIPSNYDYDTHTCTNDRNSVKYYDTKRPELIVQYVHGVLNKPKRTLIFKYTR